MHRHRKQHQEMRHPLLCWILLFHLFLRHRKRSDSDSCSGPEKGIEENSKSDQVQKSGERLGNLSEPSSMIRENGRDEENDTEEDETEGPLHSYLGFGRDLQRTDKSETEDDYDRHLLNLLTMVQMEV